MENRFKQEWTDKELQIVIRTFASWERQNLRITHGKREHTTEDTYGLPYTSSSDFAGIWNTNVEAVLKSDETYHFVGVAITKENEIMVMLETDSEEPKLIKIT